MAKRACVLCGEMAGSWSLCYITLCGTSQTLCEKCMRRYRDAAGEEKIALREYMPRSPHLREGEEVRERLPQARVQWQRELDIPEWQDDTLGYFGDNFSLEFFSDVPPEQERTVMTLHTFFWDDQTLYDLCLDELKLDDSEREMILFTAALGGAKVNLPYQFNLRGFL